MTTPRALPPELTIYTAADARTQWLAWLQEDAGDDAAFVLDGSAVSEVDGAGVQLLLALAHSLAAQGRALRLADAAPALRAACERLGLAALPDTEVGA